MEQLRICTPLQAKRRHATDLTGVTRVRQVLRLSPAILSAAFGMGVWVAEWCHHEIVRRPPPHTVIQFLERYTRGEFRLIVIGVVVAPIIEEFLFRKLLAGWLLRYVHPLVAISISALVFAIAHGNAFQAVPGLLMGLLLGWIYARTRSLPLCVLGHTAYNAQWIIATAVLKEPIPGYTIVPIRSAETGVRQPIWWLCVGTLALISGVVSIWRDSRVLNRVGTLL